jgi:DNA-directed RNA polymerase specialized sigma24 family protein
MSFIDIDDVEDHVYESDKSLKRHWQDAERDKSIARVKRESQAAFDAVEDTRTRSNERAADMRAATESDIRTAWEVYRVIPNKCADMSGAKFNDQAAAETKLWELVKDYVNRRVYSIESTGQFAAMGSADTADDFTQKVMMKLWRIVRVGGPKEDFMKYLETSIKNAKRDFYKSLKHKQAKFTGLEVSAETGQDDASTVNNDATAHDTKGENMTLSSAVSAAIYGGGWDDQGNPLPKKNVAPQKYNYVPYLRLLAGEDALVLRRLMSMNEDDSPVTPAQVARELGKSVSWVLKTKARGLHQVRTFRQFYRDHFDAWQKLKDWEVCIRQKARMDQTGRALLVSLQSGNICESSKYIRVGHAVELAPVTGQEAAYRDAASIVAALYYGKTHKDVEEHKWDSEAISLLILAGVAAESILKPGQPVEALILYGRALYKLADYYSTRYASIVNHVQRSKGEPVTDLLTDKHLVIAAIVSEREKPRQWALKALPEETVYDFVLDEDGEEQRVEKEFSDMESAKLFVEWKWEAIERLALAILDRGSLTVNEVRAIVAGVNDNELEQAAMLEEVTAA